MAVIVDFLSKFDDKGVKDAEQGIDKVEGAAKKMSKKDILGKMALPAAGALSALGGAAFSVARSAADAANQQKKLNASFAANGYAENADAAGKYAEALGRQIAVDDDAIKASQQKLAAFDNLASSQENMARATEAAANLSAAGFGTMDSAAVALGKAIQSPERGLAALNRMGVVFSKEQQEQIKNWAATGEEAKATNAILEQVEATFGGVAEASADQGAQVRFAVDEAKEALGAVLLPILEAVAKALVRVAGWVEENSTLVMIAVGVFAAFSAAILVANAALKTLAVIEQVIKLVKRMNLTLLASPWFWVIAAVVLLATIIIKNWDKIWAWTKKVWGNISSFLTRIWTNIKNFCKSVWDGITNIVNKGWEFIKKILSFNPFIFIIQHFEEIKNAVKSAVDWIIDLVQDLWDKVTGIFDSIGNTISSIGDKLPWNRSVAVPPGQVRRVDLAMVDGVPTPVTHRAALDRSAGGVVININGAVDPESTARSIRSILDRHDVRQGRGVLRAVAW